MSIHVLNPGMQTTIQAGPRIGRRHLGVPASGAADPLSLALANKLVGNALLAPALEVSYVGPRLVFDRNTTIAMTGATASATLNGAPVSFHESIAISAGDELIVDPAPVGARGYIAFAGGLYAEDVLGSPSTYLPAAIGGLEGRALVEGDTLLLQATDTKSELLQTPAEFQPPVTSRWALRACRSVDTQLLQEGERAVLFDTNWIVGRRADRMGLALEGAELKVTSDGRLPSSPVFPGTIQCPEDGVPLLLSIDAQTTGGYPRILQIARADRHLIGQLRPGDHIRLLPRQPEEALTELRAKHDFWRKWLPGIEAVI